jgi:hypothetical protein
MSRFPTSLRFPLLATLACWVLHSTSLAQAPTKPEYVTEQSLEAIPIDFEFNSDGTRAVVRGVHSNPPFDTRDVITVWNAETGLNLAHTGSGSTFCSAAAAARAPVGASDTVRVVGDRAVLIADGPTGNTTLIDVVDLRNLACLANFNLPPSGQEAGETHDLEITPNGKFAVVNCRNWIFIVNLSLSPPELTLSLNTGSSLPNWAVAPSSPTGAVDSVALTDDRGIVVQAAARYDDGRIYPIVYLIDFLGQQDPPGVTQIDMQPILSTQGGSFEPHDVAITPGLGDLAVCTWQKAVSLFDLFTLAHADTEFDTNVQRFPWDQVDSVELSSDQAVVIGKDSDNASIKVFSLRATDPPSLVQKLSFVSTDHMRAHDLALQPPLIEGGEVVAVVRTGTNYVPQFSAGKIWIVHNVNANPVPTPVPVVSEATPYPFDLPIHSRMSDSIQTLFVRVGGVIKRFGVAIGAKEPPGGGEEADNAIIDIFSLDGSPNPPSIEVSESGYGTIPFDVTVAQGSGGIMRAFVRCTAPPDEDPTPPVIGRDVLVVRFDTVTPAIDPALEATIGGSGIMYEPNMADLVLVKGNRVITIARTNFTPQTGYVHTSTNP